MYRALSPAVERFKALDDEKQEEFRNTLKGTSASTRSCRRSCRSRIPT